MSSRIFTLTWEHYNEEKSSKLHIFKDLTGISGQYSVELRPKLAASWRVAVKKLRGSFILTDLDVPIIRSGCYQMVVTNLVSLICRRTENRVGGADGFGIWDLIAGVVECGQTKLVSNPLAEVARTIGLL